MVDAPYTTKRFDQHRGPKDSQDYNLRVEQNYKDLVYLYNKIATVDSDRAKAYAAFVKELLSIAKGLVGIDARLLALEEDQNTLGFYSSTSIDTNRFNSTAYAVADVDECTYHDQYGFFTLPKVDASSISKLKFSNDDGTYGIPASLEMNVIQDATSVDNGSAVIDSSQPYNAVMSRPGRVWDRNVIATSTDVNGATCYLYFKVPNDLSIVSDVNAIFLDAFPIKSTDIMEIAYTTSENPKLTAIETWTPLNSTGQYENEEEAVGHLPPGGWSGDEIIEAGPKAFYFDPKPISAFRIKLRQKNYFVEGGKYVYSYGLSKLDVRYDKFLDTGKAIIKFSAPGGDTISSITSVTPKIWNIPQYLINDVFSYRVIWETALDSGIYTLTPVSFSSKVWIEVTLNKTSAGATPVLSGLILEYT